MKKKNLAIFVLMVFGLAYLFFDWQTSGLILTEYIDQCIYWLGGHKEAIIATVAVSLVPIFSFFGISIKKEVASKLAFKLLYIFGISSEEAPAISKNFLDEQKATVKYKAESMMRKILDSKKTIYDLERKLRSGNKLLTEEEFDRAKELINGELSWLELQGEKYICKALELVFNSEGEDENNTL